MPRIQTSPLARLAIGLLLGCVALQAASPRWKCTVDLRGKTTRTWAETRKGVTEQRSVSEDFNYSIPGILEEKTAGNGNVTFEFKADETRKADRRGRVMMVDSTTKGGNTKNTIVDSDTIVSVPEWRFESPGRGQRIFPAKVEVMLQGNQANSQLSVVTGKPLPGRPIYSIPMMDARMTPFDFTASALEFQGLALWALANAKGAFTTAASITYRNAKIGGFQRLNGTVTVNFNFTGLVK